MIIGVNIKLKFVKNSDNFLIITKQSTEFRVKLLDLKLSLQKMELSPSLFSKHVALFEKNHNVYMPFRQSKISYHLLAQGISSINVPSIASGLLPATVRIY